MNNLKDKAELLKEFIQNDPYIAFFINFFTNIGFEPILYNPVINEKTQTKLYATHDKKLVIEQNSKRLEIKLNQAQKLVEDWYGEIPLQLI